MGNHKGARQLGGPGFNGYNGYAFYRKKVTVPAGLKGRNLYLNLGYIDDVDEVYINGRKIGSTGRFPPYYSTAYNASRKYYLPEDLIRFGGVNTIAVKVYDSNGPGGIVSGNIGIYGERTSAVMELTCRDNGNL
jgi:sialate O-acetylesterase